ncbi:MAG: hypothetical protein ACHQLQ_05165 [Candidatus Acidiferrales bacterium]
MSRKNKGLTTTAVPLNFLLGCSQSSLGSFELAKLAEVANLRKELHLILDRIIDQMAQAALAAWFRQADVDTLKRALENPEDVLLWAKERIRNQQRSDAELVPLTSLPPGAAHLAAALRYAERNIAEGKCSVCPRPLARNSVRYCEKHLADARGRKKPKGGKGQPPGSIGWLYEGGFESGHGRQPGTLKALKEANEKRAKKKGRKASSTFGVPTKTLVG